MEKIWFVTGAGHGLGLALVKQLLKQGYKVAAVAENIQALRKTFGTSNQKLLMLQVELCDEDSISRAAYDAVEYFGKLDVIVNADREGLAGHIEELKEEQIRRNFEINIFSGLNVIRAVLPYLKEQRSGHIFNLSSLGRMGAGAGLGIYRATELGMIAILEALAAEVQSFGIDVTVMTPGSTPSGVGLRTIGNNSQRRIEDHTAVIKHIQSCMQQFGALVNEKNGRVNVTRELPNRLCAV